MKLLSIESEEEHEYLNYFVGQLGKRDGTDCQQIATRSILSLDAKLDVEMDRKTKKGENPTNCRSGTQRAGINEEFTSRSDFPSTESYTAYVFDNISPGMVVKCVLVCDVRLTDEGRILEYEKKDFIGLAIKVLRPDLE